MSGRGATRNVYGMSTCGTISPMAAGTTHAGTADAAAFTAETEWRPPMGTEHTEKYPGQLGCTVPNHPNNYSHRCSEWDKAPERIPGIANARPRKEATDAE